MILLSVRKSAKRDRNPGIFFDPRTVLTLASMAFAFYYTLQYRMTFNVNRDRYQRVGIALAAVAMGFNDE